MDKIEILKSRLNSFNPKKIILYNREYLEFSELEEILKEVFNNKLQKHFIHDMFRIYEKYPEEDNDIFWSMLHGIESINNYKDALFLSLNKKITKFGILMVNRIINKGIITYKNQNLLNLLEQFMNNESLSNELRNDAKEFFEYQSSK